MCAICTQRTAICALCNAHCHQCTLHTANTVGWHWLGALGLAMGWYVLPLSPNDHPSLAQGSLGGVRGHPEIAIFQTTSFCTLTRVYCHHILNLPPPGGYHKITTAANNTAMTQMAENCISFFGAHPVE